MKNSNSKKWFVYLLECDDGTFYTGITNDLEARIDTHNEGKGAKYTRGRTPVKLKIYFEFEDRSEASKVEYLIKELSRKQKEELISGKIPLHSILGNVE